MENRAELRTKVEQRQKDLKLALGVTEGQGHPAERINGIKAELRVASDALQGGWDKVSEVGAAELSKWLESTKDMVIQPKAASAKAESHKAKA